MMALYCSPVYKEIKKKAGAKIKFNSTSETMCSSSEHKEQVKGSKCKSNNIKLQTDIKLTEAGHWVSIQIN